MAGTSQEPLVWRIGSRRAPQPTPTSAAQERLGLAAQFAAFAAHNDDLEVLQHEICRVAAKGLEVTFVKLLVYNPDERAFVLQAGLGWRDGIVGSTRLDADVGTAAGFAWHTGHSVILNDFGAEERFRVPDILTEHGITRSINVVVAGDAEAAFGVLEVESPEPGKFTYQDVSFLQLLAHSLAAALGRHALRVRSDQQTARFTDHHRMSLHELQHRVRNDLQVICAVVAREARRTADPAQVAGFERVGRRVMALAGLYDHLLSNGGTDEVDMGVYLHSLCDRIADAADLSSRAITLNADTERLMVPVDRAVVLAVAINELITNAVEHAFPNRRPGTIMVRLAARGEETGSTVLSVTDDGCGFNGPRLGGAGLTFVEQLARQAGGTLDREDGGGTRWIIRLPSRAPEEH